MRTRVASDRRVAPPPRRTRGLHATRSIPPDAAHRHRRRRRASRSGLGGYAFHYAKGSSYLGNDPATCANCHVMAGHLDGWQAAPHHRVATCNDCHTPAGPVSKYVVKAAERLPPLDGLHPRRLPRRTSARAPRAVEVVEAQLPPLPRRPRRRHRPRRRRLLHPLPRLRRPPSLTDPPPHRQEGARHVRREPQPQKKRGLLVALVAGVFALVAVGAAALLVEHRRAEAGGEAPVREGRRGDRGRRRPGEVGQELAAGVRRLQAHRRADRAPSTAARPGASEGTAGRRRRRSAIRG